MLYFVAFSYLVSQSNPIHLLVNSTNLNPIRPRLLG